MNTLRLPVTLGIIGSSLASLACPHVAFAVCTPSADNLITVCSGTISPESKTDSSKSVSVFDAAANPNPPWSATNFNPNPPTVYVNLDSTANFQFINPTTANLADRAIIGANFPNSESPAVNNWVLNNQGTINLNTNSIASRLQSVISDSQVNQFTVNNAGTISASQTFFANFNPGLLNNLVSDTGTNAARYGNATLNVISAIYTDDNTNALELNNAGVVSAQGNFAAAVYGRAGDQAITNAGYIGNGSWQSGDAFSAGHWAIANFGGAEFETVAGGNPDTPIYNIVNDGGSNYINLVETGHTRLTNTGIIQGDVLVLDANPLTMAAALARGDSLPVANSGSNSGVRDSEITNSGTINGNLYLGSGQHTVVNTGVLHGSINVDQGPSLGSFAVGVPGTEPGTWASLGSDTTSSTTNAACPDAGSDTTDASCAQASNALAYFLGGRSFNLYNSGTLAGDVNINNTTAASQINITTAITNNGKGSSFNNPDKQTTAIQGALTINGSASVNNITLQPVMSPNLIFNNNTWFEVAGKTGGNVLSNADLSGMMSDYDTVMLKWNAAINGNGSLVLGATVRDASTLPNISGGAASTLNGLMGYSGNNVQLGSLGSLIQSMTNEMEVRDTSEKLRPEINESTHQSILNVTNNLMRIMDNHIAEGHMAGFMGPDYSTANHKSQAYRALGVTPGVWLEGVALYQNQGRRGRADGYGGNSNGFAIGLDTRFGDDDEWLAGAVFSTSKANINAAGINSGNFTNFNSYQGFLYSSWSPGKVYLNAMAGVGGNDISGSRFVLAQGLSANRTAMQYSARLDTGMPFHTDYATLIPVAFFAYSRVNQASYTEEGGGAALHVNAAALNSARLGLGAKAVVPLYEGKLTGLGGTFKGAIEFSALWAHEFADVNTSTSASFAVASDALPFTLNGVGPGRDSGLFGVGARLNFAETKDIKPSVLLNYFAEIKDQFTSNTGMIQGRIDF